MYVDPPTPIDLEAASSLYLSVNGYGGRPVIPLTGHTITVTLTSGTHDLVKSVPVPANTWTKVVVGLSQWPYRDDITQMSVAYAGTGTTDDWAPAFQIDDVGYTVG